MKRILPAVAALTLFVITADSVPLSARSGDSAPSSPLGVDIDRRARSTQPDLAVAEAAFGCSATLVQGGSTGCHSFSDTGIEWKGVVDSTGMRYISIGTSALSSAERAQVHAAMHEWNAKSATSKVTFVDVMDGGEPTSISNRVHRSEMTHAVNGTRMTTPSGCTRTSILIATTLGLSATVAGEQARPRPKAPSDARRVTEPDSIKARQQRALRSNGLRAAAAVTGKYEGVARSHPEVVPRKLEQLVKESHLIVVGTVRSHRSFLDQRERTIHTSYEVQVEATWKGPDAREVTVSIPGGRVGFADGSWAQINTPEMPLPMNGQRYVFFLTPARHAAGTDQRASARGPIYATRFGSVGLYLVRPDGKIVPRSPREDAVRREVERLQLSQFRLAVEDAGRR